MDWKKWHLEPGLDNSGLYDSVNTMLSPAQTNNTKGEKYSITQGSFHTGIPESEWIKCERILSVYRNMNTMIEASLKNIYKQRMQWGCKNTMYGQK